MQWSLNFGQFILHSLFYTLHSTGNSKVVSRPKSGAKNSRCGTIELAIEHLDELKVKH